jgi:hypothetical protein
MIWYLNLEKSCDFNEARSFARKGSVAGREGQAEAKLRRLWTDACPTSRVDL